MDSRSSQGAGAGLHTADPVAEARVGSTINGKYTLERVLGVGGMAAVYVATHRNRKQFAIKVLHPEFSLRDDIRKRFLREGYLANTVGHSGAVAVIDDDVAEDGSAFLVMELLEGLSIEALWTQRGRALPIPLALALVDQLLEVLGAAHARGVLHRDIKPANLFLTRSRVLKVLDFGIARLREPGHVTNATATATGMTLGTPAFMPPEQAFGRTEEVDARSDLWAVGATLFVLISGEVVHEGSNSQQLIVNAATRPARPFASVAPGAPSAVAELIDRALAFDKADRWQSAGEMRAALRQAHQAAFGCDVSSRWLQLEGGKEVDSADPASASDWLSRDTPGPQQPRQGSPASAPPLSTPASAVAAAPDVPAQPAAAPAPPRVDGPAPLAAAHIEVNISSSQASTTVARHAWLALAALLVLVAVLLSTVFQRPAAPTTPSAAPERPAPAAVPATAAAQAETPPAASPGVVVPAAPAATNAPTVRKVAPPPQAPQRAQPPVAPQPPPLAECTRLLELQSLGEALNAQQRAFLRQRCTS